MGWLQSVPVMWHKYLSLYINSLVTIDIKFLHVTVWFKWNKFLSAISRSPSPIKKGLQMLKETNTHLVWFEATRRFVKLRMTLWSELMWIFFYLIQILSKIVLIVLTKETYQINGPYTRYITLFDSTKLSWIFPWPSEPHIFLALFKNNRVE